MTPPPVSLAQEQLWFIDRFAPGLPTYNIPIALRLTGPLDGGALGRAIDGLIVRHESLRTRLVGECRRCLTPVEADVAVKVTALFSQEAGAADDPETYEVAPDATAVDLTPAVREELFLSIPRYLECREDCRGLCPRCGKDLNAGPCGCAPDAVDPRWQALAALKDKFRD